MNSGRQIEGPLLRSLDDDEIALLRIIWAPVGMSARSSDHVGEWPTWGYVEATFSREWDDVDAEDVWARLPRIPAAAGRTGLYGLVWREQSDTLAPTLEEHVGLSIAGLVQLAEHKMISAKVGDYFAGIIGALASWASSGDLPPSGVPESKFRLDDVTEPALYTEPGRPPYYISASVLGLLVQREYAPLNVSKTNDVWTVHMRGSSLRRYRDVADARTYLGRVTADDARRRERVGSASTAAVPTGQASHRPDGLFPEGNGIDAELWSFVAADVEGQHWGKTSTQSTLFLEDRIRRWTEQPPHLVGEKLMTAVFGPAGDFRLGETDGEREGWHLFAMGIFRALRNANAHRIQERDDHREYAFGVLGASSLLVTQLRFEHGSRLRTPGARATVELPTARTPPSS